jgi:HAD superfamily hydrolase (TIGR01662 family)
VTVADLLAKRDHVLLDFDGPICAVFGGALSDRDVADRLKPLLGGTIPVGVANARDPFDVLRYAASCGPATAKVVETQLRRLELEAVASAPLTPGAVEAIRSLHLPGFTITVVSNNSTDAIRSFLVIHEHASHVRGISGRTRVDPSFLKPNPFLLEQAIQSLGTSPKSCVMVGDSVADIDAARAAGVSVIAYANKPDKAGQLAIMAPAT